MAKTNKRPWFGKRWTKAAINWIDFMIFARKQDDTPFITISSIFCINVTIGIVAAAIIVIGSLFGDQDTLQKYTMIAAGACTLGYTVWFLWNTLNYFQSTWSKIGRSSYVLIINLLACYLGLVIGVWITFGLIVILVLWGILEVMSEDAKPKRKERRDSFTELQLTEIIDDRGNRIYKDGYGIEYEQVGPDEYAKKY